MPPLLPVVSCLSSVVGWMDLDRDAFATKDDEKHKVILPRN